MEREHELVSRDALGVSDSSDPLALFERLSSLYKRVSSRQPGLLRRGARFLAALRDQVCGSAAPVLRAAGLDEGQVGRAQEGLTAERSLSFCTVLILLDAMPSRVVVALDVLLAPYGYEIRKKDQKCPTLSLHDSGAALASAGGLLQSQTFEALRDGQLDGAESKRLSATIKKVEAALASLKAHAATVGDKR